MRGFRRSASAPRRPQEKSKQTSHKGPAPEKPEWNDTTGDIDKFKLTPEQLKKRKEQRISKNQIIIEKRSPIEDWQAHHAVAGSPHSDGADEDDTAVGKQEDINFGAVLQMLQQPHAMRPPKTPSPEEVAAATAAAMAEAASQLPLDLTLNPNFGLFSSSGAASQGGSALAPGVNAGTAAASGRGVQGGMAGANEASFMHAEVFSTPVKGGPPAAADSSHILTESLQQQQTQAAGEASSAAAVISTAGHATDLRTAADSALNDMHLLVEKQQLMEARLAAFEGKVEHHDTMHNELQGVRAELRQLAEDNGRVRKELSEFSSHAGTMMMHIHGQVMQLLRTQGLPSGGFEAIGKLPDLPAAAPAMQPAQKVWIPEQQSADSANRGSWFDSESPGAVGGGGMPWRDEAEAAAVPMLGSDYSNGRQQEKVSRAEPPLPMAAAVRDSSGAGTWAGVMPADAPSPAEGSWMFRKAARQAPLPHAAQQQQQQQQPVEPWTTSMSFSRSIFEDIADAPAPRKLHSSGMAAHATTSQPVPQRTPASFSVTNRGLGSPSKGRPVTNIEQDLDSLPSYAAFRRSTVVSTAAAAAGRTPGWQAPMTTFTAAPAAAAAAASAAAEVPQHGGDLPSELGTSMSGLSLAEQGSYASRQPQQAAEMHSMEQSISSGRAVAPAGPSRMWALPTQFQPRSLGHASLLVQSHVKDVADGSMPLDFVETSAAGTFGSTSPGRGSMARTDPSAVRDAQGIAVRSIGIQNMASTQQLLGAGSSVAYGGGLSYGAHASPNHALGSSMSLAAHAAVAMRQKARRATLATKD